MNAFYWIMDYFASFVEAAMCCVFGGIFLSKDEDKDRKWQIISLSSLAALVPLLINQIELFNYSNMALSIIVLGTLLFYIYRNKVVTTILLLLIYCVIISAIDLSVVSLNSAIISDVSNDIIQAQSLRRVLCLILSKTILVFVIVTLSKIVKNTFVLYTKYIIIIVIQSVFLIVAIYVAFEMNLNNASSKNDILLVTFSLLTIGIEMIVFYSLIKAGENYEHKQRAQIIEMKNDMLEQSFCETKRTFELWKQNIHDYKNNIIALKQLVEENKIEEVKRFLENQSEIISKRTFYIKTGNSIVDSIVNMKQNIAEEKGIVFRVNACVSEEMSIFGTDLANVLGNLLDNAIEASDKVEKPEIELNINSNDNFLVIHVINKCKGGLRKNMKTTKRNPEYHGIGLKSIEFIAKKYNGDFSYEVNNVYFSAKVLLHK